MRKITFSLLILLASYNHIVFAITQTPAANISVVTTSFTKCLTSIDINVQQSLNDIDSCFSLLPGGTVTNVATSSPITGGPITTTGTIGITQATTSTNGYLSSTDWNTFNNKQTALTFANSLQNISGTVNLVGDLTNPGSTMYYGTNGAGTKGFFTLPSAGVNWTSIGGLTSNVSYQNNNTGINWNGISQTYGNWVDMSGTTPLYFGNDTNASIQASGNTNADLKIVNNTSAVVATGTYSISYSGGNTIYSFTGSGSFTPLFSGTVTVMEVAGGGGGSGLVGGGGGAGGVITPHTYSVISGTPITVTIGAAGNGGSTGTNGGNTSFGADKAIGGGRGGYPGGTGANGGSGGGSSYSGGSAGTGTAGQGNSGGVGSSLDNNGGGGGGGCAGVGTNAGAGGAGIGGLGCSETISGSTALYGQGGNGANGNTGNGSSGTGYGAGGGGGNNTGLSGNSGVVIVSILQTIASETSRFTTGGNFLIGVTSTSLSGSGNIEATGTIKADTALNSQAISNLTSNGIVTTSGGVGTLSITATTGSGNVLLSAGTAAIASGKTLTVSNSLTLAGTDSTTMTFPSSSATVAGLGIAQIWTATQQYSIVNHTEETFASATSVTPTGALQRTSMQNTQTAGTFTVNNPTANGTYDGQVWCLQMTSTAVQTFSWGNLFNGGVLGLPTATLGSSVWQNFYFYWNSTLSKWVYQGQS